MSRAITDYSSPANKSDARTRPNGFGEILSYAMSMATKARAKDNQLYSERTIESRKSALISIARRTNILNPEAVKAYLQQAPLKNSRKNKLIEDLSEFYKYLNKPFAIPRFPVEMSLPKIPLQSDIDFLIDNLGKKTATFTRIAKETGARPGEIWRLKWSDIDLEHDTITINNPEKGSRPRSFKNISSKLVSMLYAMKSTQKYVFHKDNACSNAFKDFADVFFHQRKSIAAASGNERLLWINWKSLRHFKATTEYMRTKDLVYVQRLLGHKSIQNTLIYIDIVGFDQSENYVCKVASTEAERVALVESGFEYVAQDEISWYFRKRK